MRVLSARLALLLFAFVLGSCGHRTTKLCDNIFLHEGKLTLGRNETVMVCGSSKGGEGWRDIPIPQAQYQLKILLQEKGYLHPRFERDKDILHVWSGPPVEVKKFEIVGADNLVRPWKKRKIIGEPMTPEKLDEVQQWIEIELKSKGYACPQVSVKAQAWDGRVIATVVPGEKAIVGGVHRIGLEDFDSEALARYQSFQAGDIYDVRETQLTVGRMLADSLIQSAYFSTKCHGQVVDLELKGSVGMPKLFTFGFGASTEEFPFFKIQFKNSKLDDRASSLWTTLYASPRLQTLDLGTELYILPWSKRTFFGPRFSLGRKSERQIEENRAKIGADLGRKWDMWKVRWLGKFGPSLNYVNTVQGIGPAEVSYVSLDGSLWTMSHLYEVTTAKQFSGWEMKFDYKGQRKGIGSFVNVDRYELDYKHLWNIGNFSPPLFVLGSRFEGIAVSANQISLDNSRTQLPSDYRVFYGGDRNLRGFGRQSLTNHDLGYLTAVYAGFELRLIEQLPWHLEPFLLYDIAKLGNARFKLEEPIFVSEGFGLRWASPFGTLRGSAARGEIYGEAGVADEYPQEWVYFLSFGQEF